MHMAYNTHKHNTANSSGYIEPDITVRITVPYITRQQCKLMVLIISCSNSNSNNNNHTGQLCAPTNIWLHKGVSLWLLFQAAKQSTAVICKSTSQAARLHTIEYNCYFFFHMHSRIVRMYEDMHTVVVWVGINQGQYT